MALKTKSITEVHLQGNMIFDDDELLKNNKKYRVAALSMLFEALVKEQPELSVKLFFQADQNATLTRLAGNDYLFSIGPPDVTPVNFHLNYTEFCKFDDLRKIIETSNEMHIATTDTLFKSLVFGISVDRLPMQLCDSLELWSSVDRYNKEKICKQLLNYHQNARVKRLLVTHSIFKSPCMKKQPSFLFPEVGLTLEKGWVYLIAKKYTTIFGNQHAWLAYEFITNYGQRVLKVVELRHYQSQ